MSPLSFLQLVGFGASGWGDSLLVGTLATIVAATVSIAVGVTLGGCGAWAKIQGNAVVHGIARTYTTIIRGTPELLIVFVVYFGGSAAAGGIAGMFGSSGFVSFPIFLAGVVAIGCISGAQLTEVFRGAFGAVDKGEIEAARAHGMSGWLLFIRIVAPLTLRHALPAIGNVWLSVLKDTSLLAAIGMAELMRYAQVAAGSTHRPFDFYIAAAILYFAVSNVSGVALWYAEKRYAQGVK
ncbi:ABC transporter permease subunit [Mesorhizobium sp. M7D.F.Ca.US.004.03.1.1]|uniref:ABC transporter permease n=1 Tax=Mesorhizobium sp. M7D.F.Ca.US.004.03.1.1 TaxID=2496702 RepID=UPI000FCACC26|nr:ABC transporter permease subunit [Mesorhizobium sp. M7D.F.Ca.US.004.03.1.1]RVA21934.1 ABC transporter permease subunit [Mesorhizobium sp. M7D.F.Ca.US.004.03.1.1]